MTDPIGTALHALDRAAEGLSIRELDRLHTLAQDIALKARRWNEKDPERAANLILESVFDETLDAPAWRFLKASVDVEFAEPEAAVKSMLTANVHNLSAKVGTRIRILTSRNPDRVGKLATIIGERRPGRSSVTGQANYVHPIQLDDGTTHVNGKPIAVEDRTFEVLSGDTAPVTDRTSAAYALKLQSTGEADGIVGPDGVVRLDDEQRRTDWLRMAALTAEDATP